ncbi:MAG: lytic murein transglycosylase [Magnetococcales bacterium]|nr:lytic murein transglycosylase [Magnetococcales bacterium]
MRWGGGLVGLSLLFGLAVPVQAAGVVARHAWLAQLVKQDRFDPVWLDDLLGEFEAGARPRVPPKPAVPRTCFTTQPPVVKAQVEKEGRRLMSTHKDLLKRVEKHYGVPAPFVVALWGIESRYGTDMGNFPILKSLFTQAVGRSSRVPFFREQLREFLLLSREEGWDPRVPKGSYDGAIGQVQMLPGTLRRHAVDFDGDGRRAVYSSPADVLGSIAAYLADNGWRRGQPYSLPVAGKPPPGVAVSRTLSKMPPWKWWRKKGLRLAPGVAEPPADLPTALIKLEERGRDRYHVVFNNFRVVTLWNRYRPFAMGVGELAARVARKGSRE